jgi:hypothetical protein
VWAAGCSAAPAGGPSLAVGGSWPPGHARRQLSKAEHARRVRIADAGVDPAGDDHGGDGWLAGELRRARVVSGLALPPSRVLPATCAGPGYSGEGSI